MGRGGGKGTRTRWNRAGGRGDGVVEGDDQRGPAGIGRRAGRRRCRGTVARDGRGPQGAGRARRGWVAALERLVDPATRGDPTGPLRWTCSSAARLSRELQEAGHRVSERSVNRLLHALGYSLQANRKTLEGKQHPDRDAHSSTTSTAGCELFSGGASRWCRWTRRKRSSSALSKMRGGSGVRAVTPSRFGSTTFRTRLSARRFRTACTI